MKKVLLSIMALLLFACCQKKEIYVAVKNNLEDNIEAPYQVAVMCINKHGKAISSAIEIGLVQPGETSEFTRIPSCVSVKIGIHHNDSLMFSKSNFPVTSDEKNIIVLHNNGIVSDSGWNLE